MRRAVTQSHPCKVQALGNGSEKRNSSWQSPWILYYCAAASGIKSLCRAQQQTAKRHPTMGMAHRAFNLVRRVTGVRYLKTYTGIFGKTSGWQRIRKPVPCGLKKITFFIVVCSGNIYGTAGFYSTMKRNWRRVPMKTWDRFLVTSALNCLKLFQNELIWEMRVKSIKLCCEYFTTWDFLRHCNCIFSFVPFNEKKSRFSLLILNQVLCRNVWAVVLIHVLLNPFRCKFYVSTHTLTQKGQEKPLASDSK